VTDLRRLGPPRIAARASGLGRIPGAFAPRFFLALIAGLVWIGPAWWNPKFGFMILVWDLVLLLLWWIDWSHLPRPEQLEVAREWTEPATLGAACPIKIEIHSAGNTPITASVEDEVPASLRETLPSGTLTIPPEESASLTYEINPKERGEARLGRVFVRYRSALQFAERRAVAQIDQTILVYPNMEEARKVMLYLMRSRQIELEKRTQHNVARGREFESLREFHAGDELRDICWTATARQNKLVTKVYRPERSQSIWIVMDAGRLMRAQAGNFTKLDHSVAAAVGLAQVAMAGGDSVGLLAYGRKIQAKVQAARGSQQLRSIFDQLALVHGELVEADHAGAADFLLKRQSRRALIVWLTDLAETAATPEVVESAGRLLPRHLVLFVALGQPDLEKFLARGPSTPNEMYRAVAGMELTGRRELLLRRLHEHGALALEMMPGQLATGLVNQYLRIKEQSLL
jgi:uncharacterized protein (DUF58 family)